LWCGSTWNGVSRLTWRGDIGGDPVVEHGTLGRVIWIALAAVIGAAVGSALTAGIKLLILNGGDEVKPRRAL
jgi:hypothetical protein